jgi:hypothetical protein
MKAAPKSQRAMYSDVERRSAEVNETFLEMLPTMRRRDLEWLIEKRPALWGRFAGYLTSGHVFVDDPPAGTRHHATKKSPAQLDREIDEALVKPTLGWIVQLKDRPYYWSRDGQWRKDISAAKRFRLEHEAVTLSNQLHGAIAIPAQLG